MAGHSRAAVWKRRLLWALGLVAVATLVLIATGLWLLNGAWPRERLRGLIVAQAAPFLDGTLEIGGLGGSLTRDIRLERVTLSRDGRVLVAIDEIAVGYSLRRLIAGDIVIDRVALLRPRIAASRLEDGRWDIATLMRPRPRNPDSGPPPPVRIPSVQISNGSVELGSPLGPRGLTLPSRVSNLNLDAGIEYTPGDWTVDVRDMSWVGHAPDFTVMELHGAITGQGPVLSLSDWEVTTPSGRIGFGGTITSAEPRRKMNLRAQANPFLFQEWAAIVPGLRRINVEGAFDAIVEGSIDALDVGLSLRSNGGDARGQILLNTTVPGWHATGELLIGRIDMGRWLSQPERPSDATGHVVFDLDLNLGGRFPSGTFVFEGSRTAYLGYAASDVKARGRTSPDGVTLESMTGRAYGAGLVITEGWLGISAPNEYRFIGSATGLDLRLLPDTVPIPHVESQLDLTFDVTGRFQQPEVSGLATFQHGSTLLGAPLDDGTIGVIDTTGEVVRYRASGGVTNLALARVATDFGLMWLDDPRYAGTITGRFQVEGEGATAEAARLSAEGRLVRGERLLGGTLSNANVSVRLANGSLTTSYVGTFVDLDPALLFDDPELDARISGTGRLDMSVRDLLTRTPVLDDYEIDTDVELSTAHYQSVAVESGHVTARLTEGTLAIAHAQLTSPDFVLSGSGTLPLEEDGDADLAYVVSRVDLAKLGEFGGRELSGQIDTTGRLTGPLRALRAAGRASLSDARADAVRVLGGQIDYDVRLDEAWRPEAATLQGGLFLVEVGGRPLDSINGSVRYADDRLTVDLSIDPQAGVRGQIAGTAAVDLDARRLQVEALDVTIQDRNWRLQPGSRPVVTVTEDGIQTTRAAFADPDSGDHQIAIEGVWRPSGDSGLRVEGRRVSLDSLTAEAGRPARYGGTLDFDATLTGSSDQPIVTGVFRLVDGRVGRLSFDLFEGRLEYINGMFEGGIRLEQSPGVWLSASGAAPLSLLDRTLPERPMHVAIVSSTVDLGLVEGLTDVVDTVTGQLQVNLVMGGTSHHPLFSGLVDVSQAALRVVPTGARYQNGHVRLELDGERMVVQTVRIEDREGRTLEIVGSAGLRDYGFGDVEAEIAFRRFEVLRNFYGNAELDGRLQVAGPLTSPRITGTVTVTDGQLDVGRILEAMAFQPYATEAEGSLADLDALRVINPWENLAIDVALRVPGTMRMSGDNVQARPGTPVGLGDFNLRATGDLYLYKDPQQPFYVTGSLDQIVGTYSFQGRRFDLDPVSSVNFRGELSPELYVTVHRLISGVETTVSITGPLNEPELRLSSNPPLDASDVLSLIVFNTSSNDLSAVQQQQLAVRAGTLAAGFLVSSLLPSLERSLGLEIFEIEPGTTAGSGARVTIGDEIAPRLTARFSRQFGENAYDEATIEYYLSRLFRIRATFSDATSQVGLSPFYRVERAGIDLLMFFSF